MSKNLNDALLYRLQQMSLNGGQVSPSLYENLSSPPITRQQQQQQQVSQTQYQGEYVPNDIAGGIYENLEYSGGSNNGSRMLVTDLDDVDPQRFMTSNAKAQPQIKPSPSKGIYGQNPDLLRYTHTPQPADAESSPIYENLQIVSGN
jgi:hypothetical protein